MSCIPEATVIILTEEERAELEGLACSTKTEYRLRQRARIVLLAAQGMASRAIGREVDCTTGTASKWRVRYARDRLAGLDKTGNRGAEPKYTAETDKRILAVLDRPLPLGTGAGPVPWSRRNWATLTCNMSGAFCALRRSTLRRASPGVRATTPRLPPRPQRSSGFISIRPTARWYWQ